MIDCCRIDSSVWRSRVVPMGRPRWRNGHSFWKSCKEQLLLIFSQILQRHRRHIVFLHHRHRRCRRHHSPRPTGAHAGTQQHKRYNKKNCEDRGFWARRSHSWMNFLNIMKTFLVLVFDLWMNVFVFGEERIYREIGGCMNCKENAESRNWWAWQVFYTVSMSTVYQIKLDFLTFPN